jgi:hypothetical protein
MVPQLRDNEFLQRENLLFEAFLAKVRFKCSIGAPWKLDWRPNCGYPTVGFWGP